MLLLHLANSRVIIRNDLAIAMRDAYPVTLDHTPVIPARHVGWFFNATLADRAAMLALLDSMKQRLQAEYRDFGVVLPLDAARRQRRTVGLNLDGANEMHDSAGPAVDYAYNERRKRDPGFRERVLRAYEYRCCVCGFDLRIGHMPAGLEAAHIQWHHVGGPDIEPNGLSLCSLHHKLFDLGVFTVEPTEHRIVFSQHAITGGRGMSGELQFHGQPIHAPQHTDLRPAPVFLAWNTKNVFKTPARQVTTLAATLLAAR